MDFTWPDKWQKLSKNFISISGTLSTSGNRVCIAAVHAEDPVSNSSESLSISLFHKETQYNYAIMTHQK